MTDGTVRTLRHAAKDSINEASAALVGAPGLSVEAQLENIAKAEAALEAALSSLGDAAEVIEDRAADATETVSAEGDVASALRVLAKALGVSL